MANNTHLKLYSAARLTTVAHFHTPRTYHKNLGNKKQQEQISNKTQQLLKQLLVLFPRDHIDTKCKQQDKTKLLACVVTIIFVIVCVSSTRTCIKGFPLVRNPSIRLVLGLLSLTGKFSFPSENFFLSLPWVF